MLFLSGMEILPSPDVFCYVNFLLHLRCLMGLLIFTYSFSRKFKIFGYSFGISIAFAAEKNLGISSYQLGILVFLIHVLD